MILRLYAILSYLLVPLLKAYLRVRLKKGKEVQDRIQERFGISTYPRKKGKLIWLHGVSVGESLSLLSFIHYLARLYPDLNILLTTGTTTAAKLVESKLPSNAIHQFFPLDVPLYWKRFLDHWQPDVALVTESEIWPNMIQGCKHQGIPLFLINARLTEKSFKRWLYFSKTAYKIFSGFRFIFAQSESIAQRLRHFTGHVQVMPNLKFAAQPLTCNEEVLKALSQKIKDRPIIAFGSTHPGEEDIIFPVFKKLKDTFPDLLMLLAPRHVVRSESITQRLSQLNHTTARRSKEELPTTETDVFLFDTMGELGLFYRLSPISFVGGSLVPGIGGHNPIEPAQLGCAVLWGPYMVNASDICAILDKYAFSVSENTLYHTLHDLLKNPSKALKAGKDIQSLALDQKGNLKDLAKMCEPFLGIPQQHDTLNAAQST